MAGPPTVRTAWKPTGAMRLRPTWFGRVAAEIEERCEVGPANPFRFTPTSERFRWRRARYWDCGRVFFDPEET